MGKTKVKCGGCGKIFDAKPSEVRRGKGNYCSRSCYFLYRLRQRTISCEFCGILFERHNAQRRYCSRECFQNAINLEIVHDYRTYETGGYFYRNGKPLHRIIAERVLGRPMKETERIHHVNMDKKDNRNGNLLICDQSYHQWIHQRMAQKYAEEHFK